MTRIVWTIVAVIFAIRAVGAFYLPLSGDEAYYWEWSKRLALGYVDHPPAVAWTIALFGIFGEHPGLIRLGFVVCGAVATLALGAAASLIAEDNRAGAAAAIIFTLTPLASLAFGSATPDGPFLMFWCLALWLAVRAFRFGHRHDYVLLGVAIGGVLLSRMFGFALLFGIIAYALVPSRLRLWREGLTLTLATVALVYAPFIAWNARHEWVTFAFALIHRHEESMNYPPLRHLLSLYASQAAAYSPGIWLAVLWCAVRPRNALLGWTAVPLLGLMTVFVLFREVEIHWVFGAFASLCAMMGVAFVQLPQRPKVIWATATVVPAAVMLPFLFAMTFAPGQSLELVHRETGVQLRKSGPFEIFAFKPLARDVARLARQRHAIVMTDGYGLSSAIDFNAHVAPVVIGYNWQGREARQWYPSTNHPQNALFVDKAPLSERPDIRRRLARACARVTDGGTRRYPFRSAPPGIFYLTWCEGLEPDGLAILRWE